MTRYRPSVRCAAALSLVVGMTLSACGGGKATSAGGPQPSPRGVPTGRAASLVIGAAGGSVTSPDGVLTVEVPAGAVAADTDFTITEITNTAPGGIGNAYRLAPAGLELAAPVTLTFAVPASVTTSVNDLAIATQGDGTGAAYWLRTAGATRVPAPPALSTPVDHFSDWALQTATTSRDLNGFVTVVSTMDIPVTATGALTLSYAGGDAALSYYLGGGSLLLTEPVAYAGGSCNAIAPTWTLKTNVATLAASPTKLELGLSGLWQLACTGGSVASTTTSFAIDTVGVSGIGCTRGWVGTPTITADQVLGTYQVDCGAQGAVSMHLDLVSCTPGVACQTNGNLCVAGAVSCATGRPVCADTATPSAAGKACGTNQVCNGSGACVACTAGLDCTGSNPENLCHAGVTSCATGAQACVDGAAFVAGTACGGGLVCSPAGTCTACTAGASCATNPDPVCHDGVTSCSTGLQACVDGAVKLGTTCGTDQVCGPAGTCVACAAGLDCQTNPDPACHTGKTSCATGVQTCRDDTVKVGTTCADGVSVCSPPAGVCVACVQGEGCTNPAPSACLQSFVQCGSGAPVCTDTATPRAGGTACGSGHVCDGAGTCIACAQGDACTSPNLCLDAAWECGSGTPICVDGAPKAADTSCGLGSTCNGSGTCVCNEGTPCTGNPSFCLAGVILLRGHRARVRRRSRGHERGAGLRHRRPGQGLSVRCLRDATAAASACSVAELAPSPGFPVRCEPSPSGVRRAGGG
ncbi:MAG: hypothetical protein QM704_13950 [Anaeromyxobacteraceae bacterium]